MEAPSKNPDCQSCGEAAYLIRCLDCFGTPSLCQMCGLDSHKYLPFHKIELWNGKCFLPFNLHRLGLVMHLGHGGKQCPTYQGWNYIPPEIKRAELLHQVNLLLNNASQGTVEEKVENTYGMGPEDDNIQEDILIMVDVTGVHHHRVRWCGCMDAPDHHIQLLQMRLYPASSKRPRTIFTFGVLDHFYVDAMECKTAANNFFNKLRRLTSGAFPQTIPVGSIQTLTFPHSDPFHHSRIDIMNLCEFLDSGDISRQGSNLVMAITQTMFLDKEIWVFFVLPVHSQELIYQKIGKTIQTS